MILFKQEKTMKKAEWGKKHGLTLSIQNAKPVWQDGYNIRSTLSALQSELVAISRGNPNILINNELGWFEEEEKTSICAKHVCRATAIFGKVNHCFRSHYTRRRRTRDIDAHVKRRIGCRIFGDECGDSEKWWREINHL